jgi:hypothetical protein
MVKSDLARLGCASVSLLACRSGLRWVRATTAWPLLGGSSPARDIRRSDEDDAAYGNLLEALAGG